MARRICKSLFLLGLCRRLCVPTHWPKWGLSDVHRGALCWLFRCKRCQGSLLRWPTPPPLHYFCTEPPGASLWYRGRICTRYCVRQPSARVGSLTQPAHEVWSARSGRAHWTRISFANSLPLSTSSASQCEGMRSSASANRRPSRTRSALLRCRRGRQSTPDSGGSALVNAPVMGDEIHFLTAW